jgi:archaellum component FlaC
MLTKRLLLTLMSFFLLFVVLNQPAFGQTKLDSCEKINDSKDFYLLSTTSGELNSEIQQMEAVVKDIQNDLPLAITEEQLKKYKTELDNLQNKSPKDPPDEVRIQELISRVRSAVTNYRLK